MKKILFTLLALMGAVSMNAQVIKIMKGETVVDEYTPEQADKVVFEQDPGVFVNGEFTMNSTGTKVKFTKGNLYWDGSAFKFEEKQTDYPTSRNPDHVGHFFWTKDAEKSYAGSYNDPDRKTNDVPFFADMTVEGTSGLRTLTRTEWDYLLAHNKNKHNVMVGSTKCLIIAPDGFPNDIKSEYTLDEVNSLGLLCLPAAGYLNKFNGQLASQGSVGRYWATTNGSSDFRGEYLYFDSGSVNTNQQDRSYGHSLRLVATVQ